MQVLSLPGLSPFREVHALQLELLKKRIHEEIHDTLIFCEHTPTVTRGRGLQRKGGESRAPMAYRPDPEFADYIEIERGGDLTYHGPGQLVCYPIFKIEPKDIEKWIRRLEQSVIDLLTQLGIADAQRIQDASGVWVGQKKVASVGIAVRKWVSYHGIALNIMPSQEAWGRVGAPCGFSADQMISLEELLGIKHSPRGSYEDLWAKLLIRNPGTVSLNAS